MLNRRIPYVASGLTLVAGLALSLAGAGTLAAQEATPVASPGTPQPTGNGAIFFHPDGTSANHWDALRFLDEGPDGELNWSQLAEVAPYAGPMSDQLTSTSNGGAVTHAT